MRVTMSNLYKNFLYNQQTSIKSLNTVTQQLATGKTISNIYDDPSTFINALRLDQEEASLTNISSTATQAQTFADQTDTTLNDMTTVLDEFKTKLLDAANGSHSSTSYNALAEELEGLLSSMKDLANTSINGKYLFSGTLFNTTPIDDQGNYNGNSNNISAKVGSNVEVDYNIDGESLFLGRDDDYAKHISLNVIQYDKLDQNPEFVVMKDGQLYIDKNIEANGQTAYSEDYAVDTIITESSQIRALTGVSDIYDAGTDSYSDGTSYFYISGRNPSGDTFKEKIELDNSATVEDLMDKIGQAYGNTPAYSAVDVTLNESGEIEITDTTTGKLVTDFSMVASDADRNSINDLISNGDYIVSFNKSDFASIRDVEGVTANNLSFDNANFQFNTEFRTLDDEEFAKSTELVSNVLYSDANSDGSNDLDNIRLTGTDTSGNAIDVTLNITATTTMQDLQDQIETSFGDVTVTLSDGKLNITDNTLDDKTGQSNFSLSMDARDATNNSLSAFSRIDSTQNDKTYFSVNGSTLESNVSQIIKDTNTYATNSTRLIDVSGDDDIDPKTFNVSYTDINGVQREATITLRDTEVGGHLSTFEVDSDLDGVTEVYDILDDEGNKTPIHDVETVTQTLDPDTCELCTTTDVTKGVTYQQLSDVVSMLMSGEYPASNSAEDIQTAITNSRDVVDVGLNDSGELYVEDKDNSTTDMKFAIYDSDTDDFTDDTSPVLTFNSNNAVTIDSAQLDIFEQLESMIEDVRNGKVRADGDSDDPRSTGIQGALELVDHIQDHVIRKHTEIGSISNTFSTVIERTSTLIVNTQTLKSEVLDTDIAEATLELQQLTLNYQAMLSTINKVSSLSLVNYMS
jgi:flagellar hook-associated protein 3 FlgL